MELLVTLIWTWSYWLLFSERGVTGYWNHYDFALRVRIYSVKWPMIRRNFFYRWALIGSLALVLFENFVSAAQIHRYSNKCMISMQIIAQNPHKLNMASICFESTKIGLNTIYTIVIWSQNTRWGFGAFFDFHWKVFVRWVCHMVRLKQTSGKVCSFYVSASSVLVLYVGGCCPSGTSENVLRLMLQFFYCTDIEKSLITCIQVCFTF